MRLDLKARLMFLAALLISASVEGAPAAFFSDLDSGPNSGGQDDKGAFVTVWGKGFGTSPGTVTVGNGQAARLVVWTDTQVSFQLGAEATTGEIVVRIAGGAVSNGIPFTVRPGRIYFVTSNGSGGGSFTSPMSPAAVYSKAEPGDTFYFRAGTYAGQYGSKTWGSYNYTFNPSTSGARGKPLALVGYPGEIVVFQAPSSSYGNITLGDGSGVANFVTIANLVLKGASLCIAGGGFWRNAHSGASNVRVVGNVLSASYKGSTGGSGLIVPQNDHWRILGNEFKDTGDAPAQNLNHAIYAQVGASDLEIGWNSFHHLIMGHVIQVHTDIPYLYEDVRIHDNALTATNSSDSRGITISNVLPDSHGAIYNNVLHNLGQRFSGIAVYNGNWKIYNNTLYNINAPAPAMVWLSGQFNNGRPTAEVFNNIFYSDGMSDYVGAENGATMSQITLTNNLYFNFNGGPAPAQDKSGVNADPLFVDAEAGDFRLKPGSPAIDRGIKTPAGTRDRDGIPRPQGRATDIGAYESSSNPGTSP